jgi:protein-disulfide isomerase
MEKLQAGTRHTPWLWVGLTALLLLIGGCTVPLIQSPTPAAEAEATTPAESAATTVTETVRTPPVATETYQEIPVGFTAEGYPFRGAPDAPITVYEYSDFQCPFCARYFVQTEPSLNEEFVRAGQLRVVFRDFPIAQLHPNAPAAHVAALCVAEQGSAARYWEMHDELFTTQTVWSNLTDPQSYLVDLAEEVGADVVRFNDCVASGVMQSRIEQSLSEGQSIGINSTPSFNFVREATAEAFQLIGAQPYEQFAGMITALAAGETPPQAQQAAEQSGGQNADIPFWATAEGLVPDPARPGYTVAGDQYRGNPDAKVVVIEFSDFQCPYCRQHVTETQPVLDETFVDTDEVMWVFKHFPLNIHPQAEAAGVAAECAADQQKFWEMHDLLFTNVEQWSISDPNPIFAGYAQELALDTEQFDACVVEGEAMTRVQNDMNDGAPFVQGTPAFVVLFNGEGRIIPGALPADRFSAALEEVLALAGQE